MNIPYLIIDILNQIISADYRAYLVGGCVRDLILEKKPKDWDVATDALPEEILKIFPDAIYENEFGTVRVKTNSLEETLKIIEVTTFRKEGEYKDFRHPAYIEFSKNIEDDLSRRDFTINAIALEIKNLDLLVNKKIKQKNLDLIIKNYNLIDPFDGQKDINKKIIKAVGNPNQRFKEDALRLLRAIRFAVEFDFMIESKTYNSIIENNFLIKNISAERIRDEFIKIIQSNNASRGILLLEQTGLLKFIIPELSNCVGVSQNKHHKYDVFEHSIKALQYAVSKNYSLEIRLAALFHDIGKPQTKKGDGENATFYNHEYVSAKLTKLILERLKFPKEVIKKVVHLVRYHMFYYNVGEVTESGVRRFIARVGQENIDDLIKVREADRIGSGVPKARVYKIRHLLYMIEKVRRDPISPKMLKINGNDLIKILKLNPGPRIGQILNILLEEVIDNPQKNSKEYLTNRAKELNKLNDNQLNQMVEKAKQKQQEFEKNIEKELRKKYYV